MSSVRVYINPMDTTGAYTGYEDVTKYVESIGQVKQDADSLDFQLGVFRNANVAIKLNNRDGRFSDVSELESMFAYTRSESKVKITWMEGDCEPMAGFVDGPEFLLSPETTVFEGLLNDDALKEDANTEVVEFQVLGFESLFARAVVPYSSIAARDLISELLYACLNQAPITDFLTVSLVNITPDEDLASDAIEWLENKTVKEAVDKLLLVSNSVLKIESGVIYVAPRTASATVQHTFYGPAASDGIENIIGVTDITSGINRCFNYFYWKDSAAAVQMDSASVTRNKARKKELDFPVFTDLAKQATLMEALLAEFKDPKKELRLTTTLNYETLALKILDKISIDYPTVFVASDGFHLPVCGIAVCGSESTGVDGAVLPRGLWSLTIDSSEEWKILAREIDTLNDKITFKLRKV